MSTSVYITILNFDDRDPYELGLSPLFEKNTIFKVSEDLNTIFKNRPHGLWFIDRVLMENGTGGWFQHLFVVPVVDK